MAFSLTLTLAPQTELDAVNQMLMSIGQAPVNTLAVAGIKDVSFCRLFLHNASREVQAKGWYFNTDDNYTLAADVDGKINVPANALSLDPSTEYQTLVERYENGSRRLYDRQKQSFVIGQPVKVDITWFFAFTELPEPARAYIAHRAARVFQAGAIGSQILYKYTQEREYELLAELEREQLRTSDVNFISGDERASRIFHR